MLFFAFLITNTYSWWGHAHMIIAQIASTFLTKDEVRKIEKIINYGTLPTSTIVSCASWQDDVKSYGFSGMGNWHFIDTPLLLNVSDISKITLQPTTYNVTDYLVDAKSCLDDKTTKDKWVFGFHIRSIIHFVGDVHTPHHSCQMYSDTLPKGDLGGNRYYLDCEYGSACNNIHFLWDSAGLFFPLLNPITPFYLNQFNQNASKLMDEFPISYFTSKNYNIEKYSPFEWANESFTFASEYGYSTPINRRPSDEYFSSVQQHSKERIALAGYRLGHLLKNLIQNVDFDTNLGPKVSSREIVVWVINALLFLGIVILAYLNVSARRSTQ